MSMSGGPCAVQSVATFVSMAVVGVWVEMIGIMVKTRRIPREKTMFRIWECVLLKFHQPYCVILFYLLYINISRKNSRRTTIPQRHSEGYFPHPGQKNSFNQQ